MLRGVLLDVGGVFVVPDGALIGPKLDSAGVHYTPRWLEAHFAGVGAVDAGPAGDGLERYLLAYATALGATDPSQAATAIRPLWHLPSVDLWSHVLSDSVHGLKCLAALGVALGVVSNSDGTVEDQLRRHAICQLGEGIGTPVTTILDSAVVGIAKPDHGIFDLAATALGLPLNEIAYVGDSVRFDVSPARAFGLNSFHFDPLGLCGDDGHEHLRDLSELVELCVARAERPPEANTVVEYDSSWPSQFHRIAEFVSPALLDARYLVDHIGSTSVPGLAAKPVIDVQVVVPTSDLIADAVRRLRSIGYRHQGDGDIPGREVLKPPAMVGYHHMYVVAAGSKPYSDFVVLRDYLRRSADARKRYAECKRSVAHLITPDSRQAYVDAKAATVEQLLREASSK